MSGEAIENVNGTLQIPEFVPRRRYSVIGDSCGGEFLRRRACRHVLRTISPCDGVHFSKTPSKLNFREAVKCIYIGSDVST